MSAGGAAEEFISRLTRLVLRPFENPRLECYKSDLRHALNFAVSGKTAGVPGRGSRPWHGFLFPFRIRVSGFVLANPGPKRSQSSSAPGIGMESAFAVLKSISAATLMLPHKGGHTQMFVRDSCAATQAVRPLRVVHQRLLFWRKRSCEPGYKMPGPTVVPKSCNDP
jgi:hypothetical protein